MSGQGNGMLKYNVRDPLHKETDVTSERLDTGIEFTFSEAFNQKNYATATYNIVSQLPDDDKTVTNLPNPIFMKEVKKTGKGMYSLLKKQKRRSTRKKPPKHKRMGSESGL